MQEIQKKEDEISLQSGHMIDEAYQMAQYLQEVLSSIKEDVLKDGFSSGLQEINFFRKTKPQILGKLIYYNKVFRIETACPVANGKMHYAYYAKHLQSLKDEYMSHIINSDFHRYYRSGRTDRDQEYFSLGNINYQDGLNSFVFEIDPQFSTYYDYKVARILANELLYTYLMAKITPDEQSEYVLPEADAKDVFWTDSKNALIELIYALHVSGAVSYGKIGLRKITLIFQIVFRVSLGDIHHAFHRMKTRAGSKTTFLDQLKLSLDDYMTKDL